MDRSEIDEAVAKVDSFRNEFPEVPLNRACKRFGLSKDTYYLRKRNPQIEKAPPASEAPLSSSPEGFDDSAVISITRDQKSSPDQK